MGCAQSIDNLEGTLPVKTHYRKAFSHADHGYGGGGVAGVRTLRDQSAGQGHDIVMCFANSGTLFAMDIQGRYERMYNADVWTVDQLLSTPSTPATMSAKSYSAAARTIHSIIQEVGPGESGSLWEIKPVADAQKGALANAGQLAMEVQTCVKAVVVLITPGCTWDEGLLACLRLIRRFNKPFLIVHCVQLCPFPAEEEWPQDVQPMIREGPRIKFVQQYGEQCVRALHSTLDSMIDSSKPGAQAAGPAPTPAAAAAASPRAPPGTRSDMVTLESASSPSATTFYNSHPTVAGAHCVLRFRARAWNAAVSKVYCHLAQGAEGFKVHVQPHGPQQQHKQQHKQQHHDPGASPPPASPPVSWAYSPAATSKVAHSLAQIRITASSAASSYPAAPRVSSTGELTTAASGDIASADTSVSASSSSSSPHVPGLGSGGCPAPLWVQFLSPGMTASLPCMLEALGLAGGPGGMVLVVDGESCQRLPEKPADLQHELWRGVEKSWKARLMYVAEYHEEFMALLKERLVR